MISAMILKVPLPLRPLNLFPVIKPAGFPPTSFSVKPVKHVSLLTTTIKSCGDGESKRTYKKLPPSEWGHHFLSVSINVSEMNEIQRQIETLTPKVKRMLMVPPQGINATKKRMLFIYLLVSLGLACHFADEIKEILKHGFEEREEMMAGEEDLYTVSIIFWIFRTYGHNMSSDVFKRFKDKNGEFKECLIRDVKGLLSMYEAAHLATTTDEILDEALGFTSKHMELLAEEKASPPHISRLIRNALYMTQHHNNEMIFAREYISFYEQEEDHDKMLLSFAKLSFRFLQMQWIQELKTLTKWWNEHDLASKLPPYFRDRMVECYFFAFGIQAQFSRERIIAAKFFLLYTIVDDTCDRYASLCETKILADSMERWVPESLDSLPDYMKPVYKFAMNIFKECESIGRFKEEETYNVRVVLEEEFKILMRSYIPYGEWQWASAMPTFDEFMDVGDTEIAIFASIILSFLDLGHIDIEAAYKWLKSRPKIIQALARKARLMNDITGFEDDMSRGYDVNAVNYYMKQHNVSKDEAFMELHNMVRDINKLINEEFLKTAKGMPIDIIQRAINCGNMTSVTFRDGDGFTNPIGRFKDHMTTLFVNLMPI